jgi:nucleoside 2-deoxyribosyltransferase
MNIYFSCSITGGRKDQAVYEKIVEFLVAKGHQVPTAHLSKASVMEDEKVVGPAEVYQRDVNWVNQCDVLVAEVSTPSHGVGYEVALALLQNKPVFCCYHQGQKVSKMILGNDMPNLALFEYFTLEELLEELEKYLDNITPL